MPAISDGAVNSLTPQEQLQARLADPATLDSLNRLLDRLDVVTTSVEMLDGFLHRSSEIANNVADCVEELRGNHSKVIGVIENLPKLARAGTKMADVATSPAFDRLLDSGLLERLSDPHTMESLSALLDKLDLMVFSVNALEGFCRRGDEISDSVADSVAEIRTLASSVSFEEIRHVAEALPQLVDAGRQLLASGLLGKMSELAETGMLLSKAGFFEPKTVTPLAEMGGLAVESYVAARETPQRQYGLFDLLRLLKDPEMQRSIHILVEMSKQFGRKIA